MGISFKVAKAGTRYRPKLLLVEGKEIEDDSVNESQQGENEGKIVRLGDNVSDCSNGLANLGLNLVSEDPEVSFALNLFPSGFSIGKPNQLFNNVPKLLHPYDRVSETIFCAIENGRLPGDIFDSLPCKYVNGALLCEIQDYRNILSQKGDTTSSMETSPAIYKVVLEMCMENVVNDISSISDDSWTYNDLLEFESRVLKALRPDLHLDPKPMLNRSCEKPLSDKLNLGISLNRKKQILSNASAADQVLCNPFPRIPVSELCAPWNSCFQSAVQSQDRTPHIPSSIITSQRNNIPQENMSQSSLLTSQSNHQLAVAYNQPLSRSPTPPSALSAPETNYGHSDPSNRKRCGTLANREPIGKKPKLEPGDFLQEQLPASRSTMLATELLWKNKPPHQRIEAERILHEGTHGKMLPLSSIKNGEQEIFEGISKLQREVPPFRVKEEPIETSSFPSLNAGKTRDKRHIMDMRTDKSNSPQSQLLQSPGQVKDNVPSYTMQWNHTDQSIGKYRTNEVVTPGQKGKGLQHSQVSSCAISASVTSHLGNSIPREASCPKKKKSNSCPKGSSKKRVESLAGSTAMGTGNTVSLPVVNSSLRRLSVVDVPNLETPLIPGTSDPVLIRMSKLKMVTQRHALNNRKQKSSQFLEKKPSFCTTPLVGFHLMNSEDKYLKCGNRDATSHSCCSLDNNCNIARTWEFTTIHSSHLSRGNDIASSTARSKLTILEKLNEGTVEANVVYGDEKFDPIELRLLEIFTNRHHADLFAIQFGSLMMREGYRLADNQIEPAPLVIDSSNASHQLPTVTSTAAPVAETVELVPPIPVPVKNHCMLNPISSSLLSACNPRSHSNFSGGHWLFPPANLQSPLPLSAGHFSEPPLEIPSQLSSVHPQWQQHIMKKRAFSELQMLQRERIQQQVMQKRMMMARFGNISLGTAGAIAGTRGSMSLFRGENIHGFGSSSDNHNNLPAVLANMRRAENGGRALMSGFSFDGSFGAAMTSPSNVSGLAYQTMNQQPRPVEIQQQLYMQQHHELKSLPSQPSEATSSTELVGSPIGPSSSIKMEPGSQLSPRQISSVSVPRQMDSGKMAMGLESPGLGLRTPGSVVGSCSTGSSMELRGLIGRGKGIQNGGIK